MRPDLKIVAVADAAPDNWTFFETLRPDERAVDFFHACEHLGEVADRRDRRDRLVRQVRPARRREGRRKGRMRYLRGKATTKTAVLERELFRKHRRRMRYASSRPKAAGVVEAANKVLVNQRRARWSMRPERPHLQGDVGPLRRRVAGDDRTPRTTA